jgi:hypothetical protein
MIEIIRTGISLDDLRMLASQSYNDLVKAVVDIEREVMAIGGELHSDEEGLL